MPNQNSGVCLLEEFDNVIVFRTFSKGWGLAGLRAGFLVASPELTATIGKLSNPYTISEPARIICQAALQDKQFLPGCRQSIAARKSAMKKALCGKLRMAETSESVPICLLIHEDESCDLTALLASHGVGVVSGSDFMSLGSNSVRLRLLDPGQFDALMAVLTKVDIG